MKVSPINLVHDNNKGLVAVNFGYGWREEHNRGIERFKMALGINPDLEGLEQYAMQVYPNKKLKLDELEYKKEMYHVLHFDTSGIFISTSKRRYLQPWFVEMFKFSYSEENRFGINAAWDDCQFIIIAHKKYEDDMKTFYNAFIQKDILIGYCPVYSYDHGSLKFSIKSKIEALSSEVSLNINESGRTTYKNTDSLTMAEDLIYEKIYRNNEKIDNKEVKKATEEYFQDTQFIKEIHKSL